MVLAADERHWPKAAGCGCGSVCLRCRGRHCAGPGRTHCLRAVSGDARCVGHTARIGRTTGRTVCDGCRPCTDYRVIALSRVSVAERGAYCQTACSLLCACLLYTSDAADDLLCVD